MQNEKDSSVDTSNSKGGLTVQKDDAILFQHFNVIKESVKEVNRILHTYQTSDVREFEAMFCDLRHILEIENLSDKQTLKLKEIEADLIEKRRVVKNILEVFQDLSFFTQLEDDLDIVSSKVEKSLTNHYKVYNFRHPQSLQFLKDISEADSDNDLIGRYKTDQLAKKTLINTVKGERESGKENLTEKPKHNPDTVIKRTVELPDFGVRTLADKEEQERRSKIKNNPNLILNSGSVANVDKFIDTSNIEKTINQLEDLKSTAVRSINQDLESAVKLPLNSQQINQAINAVKRNSKRNRGGRTQSY